MESEKYRLNRTGDVPLSFVGKEIDSESTYMTYGPRQDVWEEYTLYQTQGGKYVLEVNFVNHWEGHTDTSVVIVGNSLKEIVYKYRSEYGSASPELIDVLESAGEDFSEEVD